MTARLLAVADDVDAGQLLLAQHQAHRVAHALSEGLAVEQPGRPEFFGSASQMGLGRLPTRVVFKMVWLMQCLRSGLRRQYAPAATAWAWDECCPAAIGPVLPDGACPPLSRE